MKKEPMNVPAQNYVSPKAKEYQLAMESDSMDVIVSGGDEPTIPDPEE